MLVKLVKDVKKYEHYLWRKFSIDNDDDFVFGVSRLKLVTGPVGRHEVLRQNDDGAAGPVHRVDDLWIKNCTTIVLIESKIH